LFNSAEFGKIPYGAYHKEATNGGVPVFRKETVIGSAGITAILVQDIIAGQFDDELIIF
jgi:hypothetical protein